MVQRIFLYFLIEKREGLAFERLKFASSTTGPSEKQDERKGVNRRWRVQHQDVSLCG